MKTQILLTSGALVLLATTVGLATAVFGHDPNTIARATTVASIFGLGSVGLFFVGLAFPRQEPVRIKSDGK